MLRRPLTSIEIKADDIDHMERVLLEAYQKKGATKTSVESDPSSASFGTPANEGSLSINLHLIELNEHVEFKAISWIPLS
ncbi:hypothetical protein OSTOST_00985 [Ostertagia ostertagi]